MDSSSDPSPAPVDLRERRLFAALETDGAGVACNGLADELSRAGLSQQDPRVRSVFRVLEGRRGERLDFDQFREVVGPGITVIEKALAGEMVIPDFPTFRSEITRMFENQRTDDRGKVADYIPQLSRVSPDHWGASVCTVDGQRIDLGDSDVPFCIQSCCKPLNYCLALEEHGEEKVHQHVGREPSGRGFNELALNYEGKPHNPMINAGAIMTCSLIQPHQPMAERFEHVSQQWRRATGSSIGFNSAVFLSERETADRNFALGYFMKENDAFPAGTDLIRTLEFYFMCCSIEVNTHGMALLAATLANGGVNPVTNRRIFGPQTVRDCMSLMYSCGMYDFSGEFAFTVGLPAKSGVAGAIMVVVPNVLGLVTWSPRLDSYGNSVRGLYMCKDLVQRYNFHNYDNLTGISEKKDPRVSTLQQTADLVGPVLWAAANGDVSALRRYAIRTRLDVADYDLRTPLHLAASEGHADVVRFLLGRNVPAAPLDRWGHTPAQDAERGGHGEVKILIEQHQRAG
jgi:glutaminase